jgi:microcystin degradation protein MlrC
MGNQFPDEVSNAHLRGLARDRNELVLADPHQPRELRADALLPPGKHPDRGTLCTGPLWVARRRAKQEGFELIEGSCFWAEPSAPTLQTSYESMRDEILAQVARRNAGRRRAARPARRDGRARLRRLRGRPDRARARDRRTEGVIGAEYDPHCHLTEKRVRGADISILFKEYPHTDFAERAERLVTMVVQAIRRDIKPVTSLYDCGMIDVYPTSREPGRGFVAEMKKLEGRDGVLSVSLGHGFTQGDVPEQGTRVLVVTDNAKRAATRWRASSARRSRAKRGTWYPPYLPTMTRSRPPTPSRRAGGCRGPVRQCGRRRGLRQHQHHPPPAGARRHDAAVGPVWDPVAVQFCHAVGVGAIFAVALRRQDGAHVRHADRRRSDGDRSRPRRNAVVRQCQGEIRRRRRASASAGWRFR